MCDLYVIIVKMLALRHFCLDISHSKLLLCIEQKWVGYVLMECVCVCASKKLQNTMIFLFFRSFEKHSLETRTHRTQSTWKLFVKLSLYAMSAI